MYSPRVGVRFTKLQLIRAVQTLFLLFYLCHFYFLQLNQPFFEEKSMKTSFTEIFQCILLPGDSFHGFSLLPCHGVYVFAFIQTTLFLSFCLYHFYFLQLNQVIFEEVSKLHLQKYFSAFYSMSFLYLIMFCYVFVFIQTTFDMQSHEL